MMGKIKLWLVTIGSIVLITESLSARVTQLEKQIGLYNAKSQKGVRSK